MLWSVVALLVAINLINNWYAPKAYVYTAMASTLALWGLYAASGQPWAAAGLSADRLPAGIAWGLVLAAAIGALCAVGAAWKPTRRLFIDRRVAGAGRPELAYQTLFRIPFGTVALEESAFRGVLIGLATAAYGPVWAVVLSSVLFGLWHVVPSLALFQLNAVAGRAFAGRRALGVVAAVAATALAGAVLCELGRRTGSLATPILVHWAVNAFGYLTAWVVNRDG
jgi:membrane protease YdiL (CAAX protease family)